MGRKGRGGERREREGKGTEGEGGDREKSTPTRRS
jgi:hypothetical protein